MDNLFFSRHLLRQMEHIRACSLSALEAPAGYGKTTAVHKALDIRYSRADETHIFAAPEESLNDSEKLTERERDVAELAAKGLHNSEIAGMLYISENTVKRHLKSAFQKLNIDRRSRLVEMLR